MAEGETAQDLSDGYGRRLEYLRLSVTEKCNFSCTYCLPNGCSLSANASPLSVAEIQRLVSGFAQLGFWKVRLTGGEPTLRRDIVEIVERVSTTPGVRHVGMTTNGYRLESIAEDLAKAGVSCLNVSMDSLDPARFTAVTGRAMLPHVLRGVEKALALGISRVKVNAVLLAGTDEAEIERFLAWTRTTPVTVRFIELMDVGADAAFFERNHVPAAVIERIFAQQGWTQLPRGQGDGPATNYSKPGHLGQVGIIKPSRTHNCSRCNRLRVSAAGQLKLCLFDGSEVSLRELLRSDDQQSELREAIRTAVGKKPVAHPFESSEGKPLRTLSAIGG